MARTNDVRASNREAVIRVFLREPTVARTDIAALTGLSAATVSSITAELIAEGAVVETGDFEATRGRPKLLLGLDPEFGEIVVFQIMRSGVTATHFDLRMAMTSMETLCDYLPDGDAFHTLALSHLRGSAGSRRLLGIGLSLQDDINETDLSVMYSTTVSSDAIHLKDLLELELQVPTVVENFGNLVPRADEELASALAPDARSDYLVIQEPSMSASVTVGGKVMSVLGSDSFDISPFFSQQTLQLRPILPSEGTEADPAAHGLLTAIYALLVLFPVRAVVVRSDIWNAAPMRRALRDLWDQLPLPRERPRLATISEPSQVDRLRALARQILAQTLVAA
ncbi:hypothetical protein ACFQ23_08920 [Schaalia naturae]|uniref:Uncharacterized protein n=1 Tax=Schaalia naturae TaxID=635203 RepID=A0ABW2SNV2_9ACTO